MRKAAAVLLKTLEGEQHERAALPFADDAARRWLEYRPEPRPGACIALASVAARKAAHRLLSTALSDHAFAQAMVIIALEEVLDRALRAMGRQPQLVAAVFASLASPDVAAIECQQQMGAVMDGIIIRAIGEPQPPDHAERTRIIGHVWYSSLVGWVNGWSDMDRVRDELAAAVHLLLPDSLVPNGQSG